MTVTLERPIGEALLQERLRRAISQDDVAQILGVSQSSVAAYEGGRSLPGRERHQAVADFLGTTVDEIAEAWRSQKRQEIDERRGDGRTIAQLEVRIEQLMSALERMAVEHRDYREATNRRIDGLTDLVARPAHD